MDTVFTVLRVVVSLGVVVGVLWFVQRRIGRTGNRRAAKAALSVVGRTSVGPKASVAVVEMDGKRFLLGVTEHGVSVLHTAEAPTAAFADELALAVAEEPDDTGASPAAAGPAMARPAAARPIAVRPAPARPAPALDFRPIDPAPGFGGLAGSILSPSTWRRALAAVRSRR